MATPTKSFDAVIESRKWKEAVARETAGMTREQLLAYFDRDAVERRFQQALQRAQQQESATASS